MVQMPDLTSIEFGLILLCILFLCIIFAETFDWSRILKLQNRLTTVHYGYGNQNGPATWKDKFPSAKGSLQSPINISTKFACVVLNETQTPIKFSSDYYVVPKCMQICNDGHSVTLYGYWAEDNKIPIICGGPLKGAFSFHSMRFHWGPTDDNGSEHTMDLVRFPLEVQAIHLRIGYQLKELSKAVEDNAVVIVSYVYDITPYDNPCLEVITNNLHFIENPYSFYCIDPIPLSWITPPFVSSYFSYYGSLTNPPCTEGVHWLIQSEPLGISSKQLSGFRKLLSFDGLTQTNSRPVQEINCRDIFLYD